jgi:hypothetical protein
MKGNRAVDKVTVRDTTSIVLPQEHHDHFEGEAAEQYAALVERYMQGDIERAANLITQDLIQCDGTLIDLSAGPGILSSFIAKRSPLIHFITIEGSFTMRSIASKRFQREGIANRVNMLGSIRDFPLQLREPLVGAIGLWCMHHWSDPTYELSLLHSHMIPKGKIVIVDTRRDFTDADLMYHTANAPQFLRQRLVQQRDENFTLDEAAAFGEAVGLVVNIRQNAGINFEIQFIKS